MQSVDGDVSCIYLGLCWALVGAWAFSSSGERGLLSSCGSGLSCCRSQALGMQVSEAVVPGSRARAQ